MNAVDFAFASAHDIAAAVAGRAVSARQVTEVFLGRMERAQPALNCFTRVLSDLALDQARQLDDAVCAGRDPGPLAGVPIGVKDIVDVAGVTTTAGSHQRFHRQAQRNAPVVERLRRAGAIIVGKTGLHEFAYGVTNINPHYGPVRNPWDLARIPGGSSGGSAAAVAAGLCTGAVGTDTGGSIRIPAALCGVTGMKPTFGRIPLDGILPLSWSLDHAGPLARTVADAALLLDVMAGTDGPSTSVPDAPRARGDLTAVRIGLPRSFFWERLDPDVQTVASAAVQRLRDLGAVIAEVDVPYASYAAAVSAIVLSAEATTYHERRLRHDLEAYGEDVRTRLLRGFFIASTDYITALKAQTFLHQEFLKAFQAADVLVMPTTQVAATAIDEDPESAAGASLAMSVQLTRFTNPFNVTGLPALSVPCGFTRGGLPVGLQIAGPPGSERTVLKVGHMYEQAARWFERRPALD